jgi:hypothetical protein
MTSIREDAAALLPATEPNLAPAATDRNTQFAVSGKLAGVGLALVMVAGLAAGCSPLEADVSQDVGNMAYPQPLAQGIVSTTEVFGRQSRDTGSMAYPDPLPQGVTGRSAPTGRTFDTGNMAYPAPRPEGNTATTYFR